MGVTFTKIELENYRQYKNVSLNFSKENDSNLHVLKAKNGTGKTTFINSITWCLYGEEKYISDADKALNLPNEKVIESTEENGTVNVAARITLKDDESNKIIVFSREQRYRVNFNIINKNKKTILEQTKFSIAITSLINSGNSIIIDEPTECEQFVNTYFNKAIFDYYFLYYLYCFYFVATYFHLLFVLGDWMCLPILLLYLGLPLMVQQNHHHLKYNF